MYFFELHLTNGHINIAIPLVSVQSEHDGDMKEECFWSSLMTINASSEMCESKKTMTDYIISKSGLGFVLHQSVVMMMCQLWQKNVPEQVSRLGALVRRQVMHCLHQGSLAIKIKKTYALSGTLAME